jgi:hypothetical protein
LYTLDVGERKEKTQTTKIISRWKIRWEIRSEISITIYSEISLNLQ